MQLSLGIGIGLPIKSGGVQGGGDAPILWTPEFADTTIWVDALDSSTITESGGSVSQWDDKSGNEYHMTQTTGSNRPVTGFDSINGRNAIYSDGGSKFISANNVLLPADGDFLVFSVYKLPEVSQTSGKVMHRGSLNFPSWRFVADIPSWRGVFQSRNGADLGALNMTGSGNYGPSIAGQVINKTSSLGEAYLDGELRNTAAYPGVTPIDQLQDLVQLFAGGSGGLNSIIGSIGEFIIASSIDEAERQLFEGYLAWKWGLEGNLPVDHPYKDNPPTVSGNFWNDAENWDDSQNWED